MTISRRQFLGFTGLVGISTIAPSVFANSSTPLAQGERRLRLRNLHTNEYINAPYWIEGEYQLDALQSLNHCLRDHRSGEVIDMDPALIDTIYGLQSTLEHRGEIHIISGYRSPKTNAALRQQNTGVAKKSLHMQGRAVDLRLPKQSLQQTRRAALAMKSGGVGYYPKSNFLHLDTGRVRQWG